MLLTKSEREFKNKYGGRIVNFTKETNTKVFFSKFAVYCHNNNLRPCFFSSLQAFQYNCAINLHVPRLGVKIK